MNTTLIIYLWGLLDELKASFGIVGIILILFPVFCYIMEIMQDFWNKKKMIAFVILGGLSIIFSILVPTSKTFAAMVIIPQIIESKAV